MDRIDIHLWVSAVETKALMRKHESEPSCVIAERVRKAREIQKARFADKGIFCNAAMSNRQLDKYCPLTDGCKTVLEKLVDKMGLSARACFRIIKLARTIADLEAAGDITASHLREAASYRFLDKPDIGA